MALHSPDTTSLALELDYFEHRVKTRENALGSNAGIFFFLQFACFSSLTFFSSSSAPDHWMVLEYGAIIYRPILQSLSWLLYFHLIFRYNAGEYKHLVSAFFTS